MPINNYFKCKLIKYFNQKTYSDLMINKTRLYLCCLQVTHLRSKHIETESKGVIKDIS